MSTAAINPYTPDPARWRVLIVLAAALFMSLIAVSIVNVALPAIQHGLGATDSDIQWVLAGYALTFGIGLVTAGRAGDIYGRGALFIIGVAIFTGTSVWSALAPDPLWLNISRAAQGIGSGLISPQAVGMIQQYFRGKERGRAFGIFGAVVGVSVAIGPVLGGILIDWGGPVNGWRWVFFVNVPVGVAAIILAYLWIPQPLYIRAKNRGAGSDRDLDPVGAIILGLAVLALLYPFVETHGTWVTWLLIPSGLLLIGVWVRWEIRYKNSGRQPMVDLAIFRVRSFSNGTLLMGLYFLGMTSIFVLLALYFQDGLGHSALASGLVGLPSAIFSAIAALWAGRLVGVHGRIVVIVGIYCTLTGVLASIVVAYGVAQGWASEWWLLLTLTLIGIGQGSVISPNQALTLSDVPLAYAGSSGGVMQTVQRIGTSVGIPVITAVAFSVLAASNWTVAFIVGYTVIAAIIAASLVVAYIDMRQRPGVGL